MMRILVVSQYFWPESFRINEVVSSLLERGHVVDVLTAKPNYPEGIIREGYSGWCCEHSVWNGAKIHRVPIVPRGRKSAVRLALNYLSFVFSAATLGLWMLRKTSPDVIFVYAPSPLLQALPALLIGKLKRVPVVLNVQDLWPESLEATGYVVNRFAIDLVESVVRFIYQHTDTILVSSRPFRQSIERFSPKAEIIYYPNSVDSAFCDPASGSAADVPALSEGFCVVFAGNVGAAQAVHVIVDAAERLLDVPAVRLVVLGGGSELEWMAREKEGKNLVNLFLAGRFPVETMPFLLAKASVLLVTLADHPIFAATVPNKIQAYLAVGRPIIACMNGEGGRIVEEAQAGIAVPAEDCDKLVSAILELFSNTQEARDAMGFRGKVYYRSHFDHEKLMSDLVGHLEAVVGMKK
jgi:glycosyltransferase involved in cell wall biosynthesis